MDKEEFTEKLVKKASMINIQITNIEADMFYKYMKILLEWNEKINLTSINDPDDIILKHFIDSITINQYINKNEKVLDIGTGAGFPGVPLKIVSPKLPITLVDSLNKRIRFLLEVCKELQLEGIECIHSRAEEMAQNIKYRENFDIVTSRAVARLTVLAEYMLPFVRIGGHCICMKGSTIQEELQEAKKAIEILGGRIEKVDSFVLPDSDIERNIIVIKKVKTTLSKYPRKAGIPSKQPIV